jgi:hypothetical protein
MQELGAITWMPVAKLLIEGCRRCETLTSAWPLAGTGLPEALTFVRLDDGYLAFGLAGYVATPLA